jgi:hypothetical protein
MGSLIPYDHGVGTQQRNGYQATSLEGQKSQYHCWRVIELA